MSESRYVIEHEFQSNDIWCECPGVAGTLPVLTVLVITDGDPDADPLIHVVLAHWTRQAWEYCRLNLELDPAYEEVDADGQYLLPFEDPLLSVARKLLEGGWAGTAEEVKQTTQALAM